MPWTAKQTRYMYANHPDIAKRVTNEPGFRTLPPKDEAMSHPVVEAIKKRRRKQKQKETRP